MRENNNHNNNNNKKKIKTCFATSPSRSNPNNEEGIFHIITCFMTLAHWPKTKMTQALTFLLFLAKIQKNTKNTKKKITERDAHTEERSVGAYKCPFIQLSHSRDLVGPTLVNEWKWQRERSDMIWSNPISF